MPAPKIHRVTVQLRRPTGPGDPGAVLLGRFVVEKDAVVLCDDDGKPLVREGVRWRVRADLSKRWERKLQPGEDMGRVARLLLLEKHNAEKRGDDFNRPLALPPVSIV